MAIASGDAGVEAKNVVLRDCGTNAAKQGARHRLNQLVSDREVRDDNDLNGCLAPGHLIAETFLARPRPRLSYLFIF